MRIIGVKMILLYKLNKNNYHILLHNIKTKYKMYHEKSIGIMSNILINYEKIPDDERKMIELMMSNIL
jgi:hypothetical protein